MARFVVDLVYGEDQEHRLQVRPAHREYSRELADRGVLLAGGPFTDGEGAQIVYEVADRDELQAVLDADPYTEAGVIARTTIREWDVVVGAWL
ncbi:YciI family protein [Saccharopolyspora indica]|uniref:YciI family protein n=1 Tax=Saccharopolyspora indica TaxID=1229659 RepID=UPI0022EAC79B|nr:YciI family protein [Saccharopolyspora indica]MDA3644850.1 YciI family protein [Saccharopolyspora indica]